MTPMPKTTAEWQTWFASRGRRALRLEGGDAPAEPDAETDPIALMTEALQKWRPSLDLKGKSPNIVMGAFMAMMAEVMSEGGEGEQPVDAQDAPELAESRRSSPFRRPRRGDGLGDPRIESIKVNAARASAPLAVTKGDD